MSETPPNQHQPQDPAQGSGGAAPGAPGPGTGGRPGFAPQAPQQPGYPQQPGHTPPGGGPGPQAPHPGAAPHPSPYPQQQPQGGPQGGPRMAPPGGPVPPGAPGQPVTGQQPAVGAMQGPAVPGFPGGGPVPASGPAPSAEDPTWAMIAHLSGIVVACLGWLPALLVHASQKQRSAFARHHASEALNFQLTLLIPYALAWIVYIVLAFLTPAVVWIGSVLIALVWGLSIVFGVLAAANANKGGWYRYPVAVRLVK